LVPRSQTDGRRVPGNPWDDKNKTFYYHNAVEAYTRFTTDAIYSGLPSIVDYMNSAQSARWQPFLRLLNQTIAAWIAPQMEPMKLADPNRLFSISWNWEALAAMPAKRVLDFHQIHKYGSVGYKTLNKTFSILKALQRTFPNQPVIMGEFGYSSDESRQAETAAPVDPRIAALHEAALMCFIRSEGLAGGIKWMLNDVRNAPIPLKPGWACTPITSRRNLRGVSTRIWLQSGAARRIKATCACCPMLRRISDCIINVKGGA